MLNVAPYSLRNRKMFDINLSDSDGEQLNQEKLIQRDVNNQQQFHIYNKETNSNNNNDKQDLKSTTISNNIQQINYSPKQLIQQTMKTSSVFRFKKNCYQQSNEYNKNKQIFRIQQSQRIINYSREQFMSNLMKLDNKMKYNKNKNGNIRMRKGSGRLLGNSDRNNIKQKKKIQYLNNSIINNQLQQICFDNYKEDKQVNKQKQIKINDNNINKNQIQQQQDQENKLINNIQQLIYKQDYQQQDNSNNDNQQSYNPQIINMPKMQFKQIIFHDPQSDSLSQSSQQYIKQNAQQNQQSYHKQYLNNKLSQYDNDEQDNKFEYISDQQQQQQNQSQFNNGYNIFSQQYRTEQYKQIRNKLLNILLSHEIQQLPNRKLNNNNKINNNNLLSLSQKRQQQQKRRQQKNTNNIKRLLTTTIPQNNMLQFEVHLYKDLFKTQYQLWIKYHPIKNNNNKLKHYHNQNNYNIQFNNDQFNNDQFYNKQQQQSILIARGYNQSFHIDKTIFIIQQINHLNHKQFIGQLQSNFGRNFYTLHAIKSSIHQSIQPSKYQPNNNNNSTTITYKQSNQINQILNISLNIYRTIYIPKLLSISNNQSYIKKINTNQSLSEIYRQNKFNNLNQQYNQVSKLTTVKSLDLNDQFYEQNNIRKSNKTLLIIDSQTKNHILFIGKIASKKYKLMVGQHLSPLQALSILIAHVQSN